MLVDYNVSQKFKINEYNLILFLLKLRFILKNKKIIGARSSDLCITQFHRILCNNTEFCVTLCNYIDFCVITQNFV